MSVSAANKAIFAANEAKYYGVHTGPAVNGVAPILTSTGTLLNSREYLAALKQFKKTASPVAVARHNTGFVAAGGDVSAGERIVLSADQPLPKGFKQTNEGNSSVIVAQRQYDKPSLLQSVTRATGQIVATAVNPFVGAAWAGATNYGEQASAKKAGYQKDIKWGRVGTAAGTSYVAGKIGGSGLSTTGKVAATYGTYVASNKLSGSDWSTSFKEAGWQTAGARTAGFTSLMRPVVDKKATWRSAVIQYATEKATGYVLSGGQTPTDNPSSYWIGDLSGMSIGKTLDVGVNYANLKSDVGYIKNSVGVPGLYAPSTMTSTGEIKPSWIWQTSYGNQPVAAEGATIGEWYIRDGTLTSVSNPMARYDLDTSDLGRQANAVQFGTTKDVPLRSSDGRVIGSATIKRDVGGRPDVIDFKPNKQSKSVKTEIPGVYDSLAPTTPVIPTLDY